MPGTGDGSFATAKSYLAGWGSYSIAIGDLNGDGKRDVVAANILSPTVSVFLGNGDATLAPATGLTASVDSQLVSVAIGDLNGDGKPDLVTADFKTNNVSVLAGYGNGALR